MLPCSAIHVVSVFLEGVDGLFRCVIVLGFGTSAEYRSPREGRFCLLGDRPPFSGTGTNNNNVSLHLMVDLCHVIISITSSQSCDVFATLQREMSHGGQQGRGDATAARLDSFH